MALIVAFRGVRYQVSDVQRAIDFYIRRGITPDMQPLPAFGQVTIGDLNRILSGPGASGSWPMPDGRRQEPGGWNRVLLHVHDLAACIPVLKAAGVRFRNEIESGPGGRRIEIEDPDGTRLNYSSPLIREPRRLATSGGRVRPRGSMGLYGVRKSSR